jgi:hypothetical protein
MKARMNGASLEVDKLGNGEYRTQVCPFGGNVYECGVNCPHFRVMDENIKMEATADSPAMEIKEKYAALTCGRGITYDLEVTK